MKINEYKTKFSVEDVVWIMYENKPTKGIVYEVHYEQQEIANLSYTEKCINIINKIKSYFDEHKKEQNVWYRVQQLNDDGTYHGVGMFGRVTDRELFHTKEELLKSL